MSVDARIIATDGKFRIVRQEDGNQVFHVLEKQDGYDALGLERWRDVYVGTSDTISKQLRDWIIGHMLKCKQTIQETADA